MKNEKEGNTHTLENGNCRVFGRKQTQWPPLLQSVMNG